MLWVRSQLEPDVERAEALAAESEALFRAIGAPFGLAHGLEGRALICLRRNEPAHAVVCLSEAIPIYAGSVELGCLAHALEAVAALLTQLDERRGAAFLLGGAEELRTKSGHAHRPWELRSRDLAEVLLVASDELSAERESGRAAWDRCLGRPGDSTSRTRVPSRATHVVPGAGPCAAAPDRPSDIPRTRDPRCKQPL